MDCVHSNAVACFIFMIVVVRVDVRWWCLLLMLMLSLLFSVFFSSRLRDERFMFLIFLRSLLFRKRVFVCLCVCAEINAQMRLFLMSHKINR